MQTKINLGNGGLSRSIHPSPCSYSDGGQLPDRGLSGLGLRWKSGRVIAPDPPSPPSLLYVRRTLSRRVCPGSVQ